jgi:hypothetical protein
MSKFSFVLKNNLLYLLYSKKIIVFLFFLFLFILGCFIYKDYGRSWDEHVNRSNGFITLNYILTKFQINFFSNDSEILKFTDSLFSYNDRDYGVLFDLPVAIIERLLQLNSAAEQYYLRHFLTFLVFLLGTFFIYKLSCQRFNDWRLGLLASLMFVLSPRFFAEGFYNSKDIVFMSFFTLGLYTTITFINSPNFKTAILHGLATAISTDIRVMGITLMAMTLFLLLMRIAKHEIKFSSSINALLIYILVSCTFIVIFWPWLWTNPLRHFLEAIQNMANFRWSEFNLYVGDYVQATKIPWHYAIVWIAVTTPPLYIFLALIGGFTIFKKIIINRTLWNNKYEMQDLFFLGIFIGAVSAVILLRSILYDGWRHLYFIYPAFIIVSIRGLSITWQFVSLIKVAKFGFILILFSCFTFQAFWMYSNHPLQNLYFNFLAGTDSKQRFDLDYWGLSNQFALQYILENDKRSLIRVMPISDNPLFYGLTFISSNESKRIIDTNDVEQAEYLVSNYRFLKGKPFIVNSALFDKVFEKKIDDRAIITVFKRIN